MDPREVERRFGGLNCATASRFKFWKSTEVDGSRDPEEWLSEDAFAEKLAILKSDMEARPASGFTLVTTFGDAKFIPEQCTTPIQLSPSCLRALLQTCGFFQFYTHMCTIWTYNMSHHIQYDEMDRPVALTLFLRIPRNTRSINLALRINLDDLSCICFLTALRQSTAEYLHRRCIEEAKLLTSHPLHILAFIFEERFYLHREAWIGRLLTAGDEVEAATGMAPPAWRKTVPSERARWLSDYDNQLRQLHATHVELCHGDTVMAFFVKYGDFCRRAAGRVDELREEAGRGRVAVRHRAAFEEQVRFFAERSEFTRDKIREATERLRTQINVVYSLVTQRDSSINLAMARDSNRVATLAARDSETMKTITIMTLLFLPASLVTSIWSANIFHLDDATNWRVYVGVAVGLTVVVFCVWLVYLRICGDERRTVQLHTISDAASVWRGTLAGSSREGGSWNNAETKESSF